MAEQNQRTMWLDVFKGLAIMAVVINHHPGLPRISFNVCASFDVPLFFFMSGYLFKPNVTFHDIVRKRFNSLLKPYFFFVTLVSLAYIFFKGTPSPFWYFFWMIYGNGPNLPKILVHLWFLPSLFTVSLFVWISYRYIKFLKSSIIGQLALISSFFIIGILGIHLFWDIKIPISITNYFIPDGNLLLINGLLNNPAYSKEALLIDKQFLLKGLPWSVDFILVTSAFFMSGYFIKQNGIEKLFHKGSIAAALLIFFIATHVLGLYTIDLNIRRYDNLFINTLIAFAAIYFFIYLSHCITKFDNKLSNFIKYIGRYTLVIFIFHPVIQSKVYFTFISLLPKSMSIIAILLAFGAGLLLPLFLNWLLIERFKFFRYWFYAK